MGANVVEVCNEVKKKLPELRKMLPPGMEISISTDYSLFIIDDIEEVKSENIVALCDVDWDYAQKSIDRYAQQLQQRLPHPDRENSLADQASSARTAYPTEPGASPPRRLGTLHADCPRMTLPRQIFAGTTWLLSRRCSERRFFLKPCKRTRDIFMYALALYAQRYRIQVHAFCVMSNHHHLGITDTLCTLPDFARDFHALIARARNCSLERWDGFWDRKSYSAVRLVGPNDVLDKLTYILANPVAAGLVRRASDWPGSWSDPRLIGGKPLKIRKPKGFFDEQGNLPDVVELQLVPPPAFKDHASFVELLLESLAEAEQVAVARIEGEGRSFLGVAGVLCQGVESRPATEEPRRQLNPRVACRSKWKRIETLQRLKEFTCAYRAALARWRRGVRDTLFPPGTWHMRVVHGACCADYG